MSEVSGENPQGLLPDYKKASHELVATLTGIAPKEGHLDQDRVRDISHNIGTHYGLPEETIARASAVPVDLINNAACMQIMADATFETLLVHHGILPTSRRAARLVADKVRSVTSNAYAFTLIHEGNRRICVNLDAWKGIPQETATAEQVAAIRHELIHELARDPKDPYSTGFSNKGAGYGINEAATQVLEVTDRLGIDLKELFTQLHSKKLSIPYGSDTLALLGALNAATGTGHEFTAAEVADYYFPLKPKKRDDFIKAIQTRALPALLPNVQVLLRKLEEFKKT